MPQIKIGPEFFAKAKNDYEDWQWALVRELAQNSIDCGSNRIEVDIRYAAGSTFLRWKNNGDPMTEDILLNKLLSLGGSGKNFEGSVGGFGKAKELCYYCHASYSIHTGELNVEGSGAEYTVNKTDNFLCGTESQIVIDGDESEELVKQLKVFIAFCQWGGVFVVNGEEYRCCLNKGARRRDLGFGVAYSNKTFPNRLVVRIGGIPMFSSYISFNRCVVVELGGKSSDVLTSNRDGLRFPYRSELQAFITEIAVNKRSALRDRDVGPRYTIYQGQKLEHTVGQPEVRRQFLQEIVQPFAAALTQVDVEPTEVVREDGVVEGVDIAGDEEVTEAVAVGDEGRSEVRALSYGLGGGGRVREVATLGHYFVVKNELDMKIPGCYLVEGELSTHARKLIRFWGRIMLTLHRLFASEAEFGLGFIFSDSAEAEYENREHGKIYYLNPCEVVEQRGGSRSLKRRFQLTERDRLIAIGAHEFVHQLRFSDHDEDYANKLTDVLGVVMKNRSAFNWCFK